MGANNPEDSGSLQPEPSRQTGLSPYELLEQVNPDLAAQIESTELTQDVARLLLGAYLLGYAKGADNSKSDEWPEKPLLSPLAPPATILNTGKLHQTSTAKRA